MRPAEPEDQARLLVAVPRCPISRSSLNIRNHDALVTSNDFSLALFEVAHFSV